MSRYICDGHEYRVTNESYSDGYDLYAIRNNYGKHVATLSRTINDEYWSVHLCGGGEAIARWHENEVIDNLLEQNAVQAYVAWAMDNDTVEAHA